MNNTFLFWGIMVGLPLLIMAASFVAVRRPRMVPAAISSPSFKNIPLYRNVMIILLLAVSGSLYLYLGHPDLAITPSAPSANRQLEALIKDLKIYLQENPGDIQALYLLADSYRRLGEYPLAEEYYKKLGEAALTAHIQLPAEYDAIYAEIRIRIHGIADPISRGLLQKALTLEPANIRARFYMALIHAEDGETQSALDELKEIRQAVPAGTPWALAIEEQLQKLSSTPAPSAE
ncbi:MAG: tetratricopeptide repeat protein [Rhodospirillaceae bacterium]|nr:tetratricopeptide repeat protein [Rhodospirillaceae bacterium]